MRVLRLLFSCFLSRLRRSPPFPFNSLPLRTFCFGSFETVNRVQFYRPSLPLSASFLVTLTLPSNPTHPLPHARLSKTQLTETSPILYYSSASPHIMLKLLQTSSVFLRRSLSTSLPPPVPPSPPPPPSQVLVSIESPKAAFTAVAVEKQLRYVADQNKRGRHHYEPTWMEHSREAGAGAVHEAEPPEPPPASSW